MSLERLCLVLNESRNSMADSRVASYNGVLSLHRLLILARNSRSRMLEIQWARIRYPEFKEF